MRHYFALILVLLFISNNGHSYPYLFIKPGDVQISDSTFERIIKPELRAMNNEFKQLLPKINPLATRVLNLHTEIIQLRIQWDAWKESCLKQNEQVCTSNLRNIYSRLRNIDLLMNQLDFEIVSSNVNQRPYIDSALSITLDLAELSQLSYTILHQIELVLISDDIKSYYVPSIEKKIAPFLWQLFSKSEFMIAPLMPSEIKDLVESVWQSFFREIEIHVINQNNKQYLLTHLEDLNLAWNGFNMIVSRGNLSSIKPFNNEVTSMHYHWNGVLRAIVPSKQDATLKK